MMQAWPTQDGWNIRRNVEKINPSPFFCRGHGEGFGELEDGHQGGLLATAFDLRKERTIKPAVIGELLLFLIVTIAN